jgi:hypothetical protein
MAPMDAIEIAERHHRAARGVRNMGEVADDLHKVPLTDPSSPGKAAYCHTLKQWAQYNVST